MAKKKYSFKCLEQNCESQACHLREHVNVTVDDLARWMDAGYLQNILSGLVFKLPKSENEQIMIETRKKDLENQEGTACIFYHEESRVCEIEYSRPISCRTYPLKYNGDKFYVSNRECPGIGKGKINRENLKKAKEKAEQDFNERNRTISSLPALYSLIMGQLMQQSAEAMQGLSEEDRKRVQDIMSKQEQQEERE
ncbi:MAG: YkgJ family cysteine cluster protein [Promethearchaeia archaeon]